MLLAIEETVFQIIETYGLIGLIFILFGILVYKLLDSIIKSLVPKIVSGDFKVVYPSRKKRKDSIFKVNNLLTEMIEKIDADRVALFEYHNGGYNLSNLPFLHFSLTLQKGAVGVDELSSDFKNVFVSSVPDFIQNLEKNAIYQLDDITPLKTTYPRLYRELYEDCMNHVLFCNIEGSEEQIGFLMVGFKNQSQLPVQKLKKEIIKKVQKIAIQLDGKKN